eukprot:2809930-Pleurochrysis_carterae.AAC.4
MAAPLAAASLAPLHRCAVALLPGVLFLTSKPKQNCSLVCVSFLPVARTQSALHLSTRSFARRSTAKLEVQKKVPHNPIMQDTKKGELRYYSYGAPFFNYGMLPQTWEDPSKTGFNGTVGDNDPLDVMELGSRTCRVGEVRSVKVLGDLELIDQGELDHKVLVIDTADPMADKISSAADLLTAMPGVTELLVEWLKM